MRTFTVPVVFAMVSCSGGPGPIVPETKVERQMMGLLEKFDRWDENGDGQLRASELGQAESMSGYSRTRILEFYDTDRSGGITLQEGQSGLKRIDEAERKAKR